MISFVNLMANDVWSEADIKSRLHSEIRSVISEQKENEISRAIQGRLLGMHTLTPEESASIALFKQVSDKVALLAVQARADAVLLSKTMTLEFAQNRLTQPATETEEDIRERDVALAVVAAAIPSVVALAALRKPALVEPTAPALEAAV